MSILNAKNNMFTIWFPPNFFYPDIVSRWTPIVQRLKLPYQSLEDFFNAAVQSVSLPSVDLNTVTQQQSQFEIAYRGGKEMEVELAKELDITFKLTEGFLSYWIIYEQIEAYLEYKESIPFWPSLNLSFLDMHGFELVGFKFMKIVPLSLSQLDLNYSSTAAEFNTFSMNLRYNRFSIDRKYNKNNS